MTDSNILPSGQTRIDSLEMHGITKRFPGVLANHQLTSTSAPVKSMPCWVKMVPAKAR